MFNVLYRRAILVEGKRWYVEYYQTNPATGKRNRYRETHDMNRIKNLRMRRKLGRLLVEEINQKLPEGYPFMEEYTDVSIKQTGIIEALKTALEIKCRSERDKTRITYESQCRIFVAWLQLKRYDELSIGSFGKVRARQFFDYLLTKRKVSATTHNNYLVHIKALFNELLERGYVYKNPIRDIKQLKQKRKVRRPFTSEERKIVADYIRENEPVLFLAICLQYYCFIRPTELRRLKFKNFDLIKGVIRMKGEQTKNWDDAVITIPDILLPIFDELHFSRYKDNDFVFGTRMKLGGKKPVGTNTMRSKHREHLKYLHGTKQLENIKGLQFYSWKDTGAQDLASANIPLNIVKKQLRHKSLATTDKYMQNFEEVTKEIKELRNFIG